MTLSAKEQSIKERTEAKAHQVIKKTLWRWALLLPLTSFVFFQQGWLFDMTRKYPILLAIMIAALIAMQVAAFNVIRDTLYYVYYAGIVSYLDSKVEDAESRKLHVVEDPDSKV